MRGGGWVHVAPLGKQRLICRDDLPCRVAMVCFDVGGEERKGSRGQFSGEEKVEILRPQTARPQDDSHTISRVRRKIVVRREMGTRMRGAGVVCCGRVLCEE